MNKQNTKNKIMPQKNKLHNYCVNRLIKSLSEYCKQHHKDEIIKIANDPSIKSKPKWLRLTDEGFFWWYACKNSVSKIESLIQRYKQKSCYDYYKDKIKAAKYKQKAAKKVSDSIYKFKASNMSYDSSTKLVVHRISNRLYNIMHLIESGEQINKLFAADMLCINGRVITGAKSIVVDKAQQYFGTCDITKIRNRLIKKYGQVGFDLRMGFVESPFNAGVRMYLYRWPDNSNRPYYDIIDDGNFEKLFLQLDCDKQNALISSITKAGDYFDTGFYQYTTTSKAKKYNLRAVDFNEIVLKLTLIDPNDPMLGVLMKLVNLPCGDGKDKHVA